MDSETDGAGAEVEEEEVEVVELHEEEGDARRTEQTDPAEAAVRQAEAEGLTLQPSLRRQGYRGVFFNHHIKAFQATVQRAGERQNLGYFATAEEAALVIARADALGKLEVEVAGVHAEAAEELPRTTLSRAALWLSNLHAQGKASHT